MKATPGPWGLRGYQIRADGGRGAHVATYQISQADGEMLAAAPEMTEVLERLLEVVNSSAESMAGHRLLPPERMLEMVSALSVPAPILAEALRVLAKVRGEP